MERTDGILATHTDPGDHLRDRSSCSRPTVDLGSESVLRLLAGMLSVLGLLVAGYLTFESLQGAQATCSVGGCGKVLNSAYSSVRLASFEVGIHWFGVIGYLTLLFATNTTRVWCFFGTDGESKPAGNADRQITDHQREGSRVR